MEDGEERSRVSTALDETEPFATAVANSSGSFTGYLGSGIMARMRLLWPLAAFVVAALSTSAVQAQTPEETAAAEALFQEARALYNDGHITEACPKFEASYKLTAGSARC